MNSPARTLSFPIIFLALNLFFYGGIQFILCLYVKRYSIHSTLFDISSGFLDILGYLILPTGFIFLSCLRRFNLHFNILLVLLACGSAVALPMFYFMGRYVIKTHVTKLASLDAIATLFAVSYNAANGLYEPQPGLIAVASAILAWLLMFKATSIWRHF